MTVIWLVRLGGEIGLDRLDISPASTYHPAMSFSKILIACVCFWVMVCQAQTLDTALRETVGFIPANGLTQPQLEVTTFMPMGDGPFPLVVINHGRSSGDARFQERYRPILAAREFVSRGYAVIVPMRQGFSKSGGSEISGGCNVHSNGIQQAMSVTRAIEWAATQPWADPTRTIVMGQSHGGLTTVAYGTNPAPSVKLLVNFAGGLRNDSCLGWEHNLIRAFGEYGQHSSIPSVWFYGDNDSYFSPFVWKNAFEHYNKNGGRAEIVAFGTFGSDAHAMFGSTAGLPIWVPVVMDRLEKNGLPTKVIQAIKPVAAITLPPDSGFAALTDIEKVPVKTERARDGYREWLKALPPKAFAIHPQNGVWASGWANDTAYSRALNRCEQLAGGPCRLYAVDDRVVWKID